MLENTDTPESPEWWLLRLGKRLANERPRFDRLECYWRGDPPLPHGNHKMREAYRRLQRMARSNYGSLIPEAVLERAKVIGFRAGGDGTDTTDREAWSWWQANGLDADQGLVHRHSLVMSRSYVIVGVKPDGTPLVTGEDPRQVIHESSPTNRRDVEAAAKTYWDDKIQRHRALVFLPDHEVHYFITVKAVKKDAQTTDLWSPAAWERDETEYEGGVGSHPFDEVPVVPFINRPTMSGEGLGEFEDVIDILDRINNQMLDSLVISAMQAYRQRWAKGVKIEDENGNAEVSFDPGADLLWLVQDDNAQFGEFGVTDVRPLLQAIQQSVQDLAAITRTPPQYLLATMINTSGDALGVAESGLVSKVVEREAEWGESWERVYRLAGKVIGREVPDDAEVEWKSPQFRTLAELASAGVQMASAGVPWRTRMRKLDFTPAEIRRMAAERAEEAMMMASLNPQPANPNGQPSGQPQLTEPRDDDGPAEPAA